MRWLALVAVLCALFALAAAQKFEMHEFDDFAANDMPVEFLEEDWNPDVMGATSFMQTETEVTGTETQELECNCEKMKCNCMKKCECAVPAKRA